MSRRTERILIIVVAVLYTVILPAIWVWID